MRSRAFLVLLAPIVALPLIRALAQDQPQATPPPQQQDRLTVRSKARAVALADELELDLVVQGTAEEAREAEKKHRDRLRRLMASLTGKEVVKPDEEENGTDDEKEDAPKKKGKKKKKKADDGSDTLPAPGVPDEDGLVYDVREGRYTLGVKGDPAQMVEDPDDPNSAKKDAELACGSCIHVTIKNLQKSTPRKVRRLLAKILDRASDAGADLGPPKARIKPALRFRTTSIDALKKQAYAEAIAKAKARAAEIADLAGRPLGKISVITDLPDMSAASAVEDARTTDYETYLAVLQTVDPAAAESSSGSSEIAVEVAVELEFELR